VGDCWSCSAAQPQSAPCPSAAPSAWILSTGLGDIPAHCVLGGEPSSEQYEKPLRVLPKAIAGRHVFEPPRRSTISCSMLCGWHRSLHCVFLQRRVSFRQRVQALRLPTWVSPALGFLECVGAGAVRRQESFQARSSVSPSHPDGLTLLACASRNPEKQGGSRAGHGFSPF